MCIRDSHVGDLVIVQVAQHLLIVGAGGVAAVQQLHQQGVVAGCFKAVSYTHLDVYKRQVSLLTNSMGVEGTASSAERCV